MKSLEEVLVRMARADKKGRQRRGMVSVNSGDSEVESPTRGQANGSEGRGRGVELG